MLDDLPPWHWAALVEEKSYSADMGEISVRVLNQETSKVLARVKGNTVQLVDEDCACGRLLGLRVVLVVKAFGGPFQDFAFDHAGVGAEPACGVDSAVQCGDGVIPQAGDRLVVMRGKKRCGTVIFGRSSGRRRTRLGSVRVGRRVRRRPSGCGWRSGSIGVPRFPA